MKYFTIIVKNLLIVHFIRFFIIITPIILMFSFGLNLEIHNEFSRKRKYLDEQMSDSLG